MWSAQKVPGRVCVRQWRVDFVAKSSLVSVSNQLGSRYQNPFLVFGPGILQSHSPVALGRGKPCKLRCLHVDTTRGTSWGKALVFNNW